MPDPILVAQHGTVFCELLPALANRHGLITGATGTGKTITLQTLAENFSKIGVPVFMADVKGDLTGVTQPGSISPKLAAVIKERGLPTPEPLTCPATLWDVFGAAGHPVRATVSDMGPLLLTRMLALNETQAGVLNLVFKICDDNGLLLLDMKDLRAALQYVGENASQFTTEYGNISAASVGAIQRGLLQIEEQGGDKFFGEPMLDISDFMQTVDGKGVINILAADQLMNAPRLYATFLLWMLSELFELLPEVGDLDKPKLVFFFDEAHLLFKDAPAALTERIELVVRLVRSKGVGVYFVTQNPLDVPDTVLAQLGNRVQHALRAFTPRDQKAVKAAAETMRANPAIGDMATAITELAVGEALVSFLDAKGRPSVTERVYVLPPGSQIGPISPEQRKALLAGSLVAGTYEKTVDRESAYEKIKGRAAADVAATAGNGGAAAAAPRLPGGAAPGPAADAGGGLMGGLKDAIFGSTGPRGGRREGLAEKAAASAVRSIGSAVGREIIRGVLGSLLGGGGADGRRRVLRWILIAASAIVTLTLLIAGACQLGLFAGTSPTDLGVRDGRPKAPSLTRNSVSSQADLWPGHRQREFVRIAPLALVGSGADAGPATPARLRRIVEATPGAPVVLTRPDDLQATFTSPLMKCTDDVEFWFDAADGVVQVRPASRLGEGDLGTHRARVEALRQRPAAG